MIDSSKPGPKRVRWAAAALAMIAAVLMGLVQPVSDVSAQTFPGSNMTLISCAATTAGPVCTSVGVPTSVGSRDVLLRIDLPASGVLGQTYTLVRFTSAAGVITGPTPTTLTASASLTPPLTTGQIVQVGSQAFVRDTVPANQQVACYQILINGTAAATDFECIVYGVAQGLVPADVGVALNQGQNLLVSWQSSTDSRVRSYLVYSLGTDGVQIVTQPTVAGPLSATLPGTGGLICAVVIPLDAANASLGASNLQCGFPGNSRNVGTAIPTNTPGPTNTRTNTATPSSPTVTAVNTATRTSTATNTSAVPPTNTNTTVPFTPTITNTPTAADLTISKSSNPSVVTSGNVVTYSLVVNNIGGQPSFPVTVQDLLPAGVSLLGSSGTNGFLCGDPVSGTMACTGGNLPPNSSATITIIVLVNTPCSNLSPFVNTARVNLAGINGQGQPIPGPLPESNFNNNTSTAATQVQDCPAATPTQTGTATSTLTRTPTVTNTPTITTTPLPDLSISKTGPSSVSQGSSITYVATVSNTGGSFASGVVVQDNLPPQVTFVSASGSNGFTCNEAAGVVGCTGGLLAPGGTATITIFGLVSGCATPLTNTAIVNPGNVIPESNFANNTSTVITTETGCPNATATPPGTFTITTTPTNTGTPTGILTIAKISNPTSVNAGQPVNYVVTVSNPDPNTDVSGIQFVDALPAGVSFASVQDTTNASVPGIPFACGEANGEVVCAGASIPRGQSRQVTIAVVTDNPCVVTSPVRNRAQLNPNQNGPTAFADTTIIGCVQATSTPTFTRTFTPTATVTLTPTVTFTPTVTNTPVPTSTPAVDLTINKLDTPDPVPNPGGGVNGGEIQYTLVINNTGTIAAANVTVSDTLDNGFNFACPGTPVAFQCNTSDPNANNNVTFLSAAGDNGFICNNAVVLGVSTVTCTGGTIGPNGGATITIVVATQAGCTNIMNKANVDPTNTIAEFNEGNNVAFSQTACGAGANTPTPLPTLTPTATSTNTPVPTATNTATITPVPGISFTKSAAPSQVVTNGQPVTYTLSIGNSSANSFTLQPSAITDVLPAQVAFVNATATNGITCGATGVPNSGSETVVCGNGSVAPGATATITIIVNANNVNCSTGSFSNTATLFVSGQANQSTSPATVTVANCTVTNTPTNTSTPTPTFTSTATPTNTATPTATATPGFDIAILKSAPATVTANQSFNYVVTVTNNGPNTATGVQVLDNLPPSTQYSFSSATPSGGGFVCTFNAGPPQTVSCSNGTLTNGQSITITINGTVTIAACGSVLINQAQVVTPNTVPANDIAATATTVNACADLDVVRTDVSPIFGPESAGNGTTWRSTVRYLLFNDSLTPITGITFTLNQQNLGNNTNSFGNFAINGTGACPTPTSCPAPPAPLVVAGWTCSVTYPDFQHAVFTCTGDLAADPGTPNNNASGGGASQVLLDFEIDNETFGGPPATVNGTSDWTNTVSCTSPTPCTNLVASPANSDASQLIFTDSDTISIAADVDLGATNDVPAGQDLSAASATTTAGFAYTIFNDSFTPIGPATGTTVTFSGTLSGSAPRNTAIATVANGGGSPAPGWSCTTTQSSWSCTGTFTAETAASALNNAPDAGAPDSQVTITLLVPVGPGDAAGQTVVFTPNAVTCTGTLTCTSTVVSPGNIDGSNLTFGANTDTLAP